MIFYGMSMSADNLGGNIYRNFVLISAVEIPATVFAIAFMDKFGRKRMTLVTMLMGSLACISIALLPGKGDLKFILGILTCFSQNLIQTSIYYSIGPPKGRSYEFSAVSQSVTRFQEI